MEQILWIGKSHTYPKAGVKRHSHPYYHMFLMVTGSCHFQAGDQDYEVTPGQCLVVPPGMEHAYSNEGVQTMDYYELKFSLHKTSADKLLRDRVSLTDEPLSKLLIEQIFLEYTCPGSLTDEAAAGYLSAVLHLLTRPQRLEQPRQFHCFDASAASPLSQQIVGYLEEHYGEEFSLDSLAATLDYNKSYLCVAFKKDVGLTILDCLNTIRIRRAAELIVYSDHPLAQVAERCGFSSVSHFNRVFLKYVGITPGQCRRAYPVDALVKSPRDVEAEERPNPIMYSVLAQKQITADMIQRMADFEE